MPVQQTARCRQIIVCDLVIACLDINGDDFAFVLVFDFRAYLPLIQFLTAPLDFLPAEAWMWHSPDLLTCVYHHIIRRLSFCQTPLSFSLPVGHPQGVSLQCLQEA